MPSHGPTVPSSRAGFARIARYIAVGLLANLVAFGLYLGATAAGLPPVVAVSLVYLVAIGISFRLNQGWTFAGGQHRNRPELLRYLLAYGAAWIINLALLLFMTTRLGMRHEIAQGLLVIAIAGLLYGLQRRWVFAGRPAVNGPAASRSRS